MPNDFKEIYDDKGKSLSELLQEWINENKAYICCKYEKTELESTDNR